MSILNAWVVPTEALIAVDTDGAKPDGSPYSTSKLLPIPHLNAVLALSGQAALLNYLFLGSISAGFTTFDEFNAALPAMLEEAVETMPAEAIAHAPHVKGGNVLIATGWSDASAMMLGRRFVQRDHGQAFAGDDFTTLLTPWPPALQAMRAAPSAVDEISRRQVDWIRAEFPGAVLGGKLIACRVTREGIAMAHRLDFPAAMELAS